MATDPKAAATYGVFWSGVFQQRRTNNLIATYGLFDGGFPAFPWRFNIGLAFQTLGNACRVINLTIRKLFLGG